MGEAKTDSTVTGAVRKRFIQMKYGIRAWAPGGDDVDIISAIQNEDLIAVFSFIPAGRLMNLVEAFACSSIMQQFNLLSNNSNPITISLNDAPRDIPHPQLLYIQCDTPCRTRISGKPPMELLCISIDNPKRPSPQ
jgi:hypothetical protein